LKKPLIPLVVAVLLCAVSAAAVPLRVKDLAAISDGGSHKLIGYGLVVGLQGTGDGKKAVFTLQALANMLEQFGLTLDPGQLEVDNVAAVMVTAELPAHASEGAKLDVTVASLGDAKSLQGGMLLLTPLRAADGQVYAIAQGAVSIGGYNAGGGDSKVSKNHSAVGRVPNGASIVREVAGSGAGPGSRGVLGGRQLALRLHQPDFTTAQRLAEALNAGLGVVCARAVSAAGVQMVVPADCPDVMALITRVENLPVEPDMPARVVINERTGTVVIGSQVRILPVAIAHGALTVKAQREYQVSQPPPLIYEDNRTIIQPALEAPAGAPVAAQDGQRSPLPPSVPDGSVPGADESGSGLAQEAGTVTEQQPSVDEPTQAPPAATLALEPAERPMAVLDGANAEAERLAMPPPGPGGAAGLLGAGGRTVVVPKDTIEVAEEQRRLLPVGGEATLNDLVVGLNALGVSPRDLIAIIQALKQAGALQAELIIQ